MNETTILNMFPNEIEPCEGEIKVKAYHCAELQSKFLRTVKAEGVLTVTNKRVIFRTKGIKNDKNFIHSELPIEDVTGITVGKGRYFDILKVIIIYLLGLPVLSLPFVIINTFSTRISNIIGSIFKLNYSQIRTVIPVLNVLIFVGLIVLIVFLGRKNKAKLDKLGVASKNILQKILSLLNPFKSALTLQISSKSGQGGIALTTATKFGYIDLSADPVPTDEAVSMMKEVGAVINDIQKLGDMGIEKWKK